MNDEFQIIANIPMPPNTQIVGFEDGYAVFIDADNNITKVLLEIPNTP